MILQNSLILAFNKEFKMEYIFYVSFQENDFQKYSKAFLIKCTESQVCQKVQELKKKYSEELEGKDIAYIGTECCGQVSVRCGKEILDYQAVIDFKKKPLILDIVFGNWKHFLN